MGLWGSYRAVTGRELKRLEKHKTFFLLSICLPVFSFLLFILIFRSGVPRDMPVAVLDGDKTPLSRQLGRMIDATPSAKVMYSITSLDEGETMMKKGEIDAVIEIPKGLEKSVYSNSPVDVMVYISGLNLTKNGLLNKDLQTALVSFSGGIQVQTLMKQGIAENEAWQLMMPIYFERHILFNPYINYGYYLLPSFLSLMLMLFILLSSIFSIGVELKTKTAAEWMNAANGNAFAALTGKLLPYTVIFYVLYILMNTILFKYMGIPLRGSTAMLYVSGFVYILSCQAVGTTIIILLSNMRLGLSIGGGYSVLAFTFSGLTFPFLAMGMAMQITGRIFPLTCYMEIFIDQAMRGAPVVNSVPYIAYMLIFLLLPLIHLPRLYKITTDEKYWGRL